MPLEGRENTPNVKLSKNRMGGIRTEGAEMEGKIAISSQEMDAGAKVRIKSH